jgi:acyl-coenzyme A thioesterase PaaI-like protein
MNITQLPFNQLIGLQHSEQEGYILSLPHHERYTNHLGTVHASALMALAEASSGEVLLRAIGQLTEPLIPVVRRFESKFRKPAQGAIASRSVIDEHTRTKLITDLNTKKRASIEIAVDIFDEADQHCLSAQVEWFIASQPKPTSETVS